MASKWIYFALVSFLSTVLLEVLLEGASTLKMNSTKAAVALGLTVGEFGGCCLISKACGGRLTDGTWSWKFWQPYIGLSLLLLCGSGLPNLAVQWVQYPLKVSIKSSKLTLAMAVAASVGNSPKYSAREYFLSSLLVVANLIFSFGSGKSDASTCLVVVGAALLVAASLSDVLAVNGQQSMMQKQNVEPMSMMLRQNFIGLICSVLLWGLTLGNGSYTGLRFADLDCQLVLYILGVGICTGLSAWGNTNLVKDRGAVKQASVSSFRKLLTVMISYYLFPKPFGWWRGLALTLVVGAVAAQHSRFRVACWRLLSSIAKAFALVVFAVAAAPVAFVRRKRPRQVKIVAMAANPQDDLETGLGQGSVSVEEHHVSGAHQSEEVNPVDEDSVQNPGKLGLTRCDSEGSSSTAATTSELAPRMVRCC